MVAKGSECGLAMQASILRSSFRSILRFLALTLVFSISLDSLASVSPPVPIDPVVARHAIQNRGIGRGIHVTEVDGTNVRGIITAIHEDTFEVTPKGTTQSTTIPFAQLVQIRNDGHSHALSIGQKILIGAGVFFIVSIIIFAAAGGNS